MRPYILVMAILLFLKNVHGAGYRHVTVNKKRETSFYISLGLLFPYNTSLQKLSTLQLDDIDPNSPILNLILDSEGTPAIPYMIKEGSKETPFFFNNKRIGAGVTLGYKSAYFWRTDIFLDFTTATRSIALPKVHWDSSDPTSIGGDSVPTTIDFTLRQFALLFNIFIDFDNITNFTPFIGAGAGFASNQGFVQIVSDKIYREPDRGLVSRVYLTYELKWGVRLGSRKAFTNLEFFHRKTPKIEYYTKGVRVNFGFRI